jgi:signal transduction histidine kinase
MSKRTRRPHLFNLMLLAFGLVIVLGIGGMVSVFLLAVLNPVTMVDASHPRFSAAGLRGLFSAVLALAAVLLGLATIFSRRISEPIRRVTAAARAMAAGDMSARAQPGAVREVHDLAEAFNSMADSLGAADQQRRQLTADVAHELRTPLSIIRARLEGIQDGVYAPEPEQIRILLGEAALLERLIEDLRLLALADAGQLPLYREPLDPATVLRDAARAIAPEAAAAGVALHWRAEPDLPEMLADPQRVAQVLGNLLGNALRHTPAGGSVTLRANAAPGAAGGHDLVVSVADTGSGIAPADLPHIFDRFYRADRARSRSLGGAGLGLAIARRIVEAHGGRVGAWSRPGEGTIITFTLPLTAAGPRPRTRTTRRLELAAPPPAPPLPPAPAEARQPAARR